MKKIILFTLLLILLIIVRTNDGSGSYLFFDDSQPFNSESCSPEKDPSVAVTVTAYSPTEEECDSDPYITAYQKPVREGTIAISRDLEKELGWRAGDRIHLNGLGVFEVNDRMSLKWRKRVDIFFHDTEKAVSFGIKQARAMKIEGPQNSLKKKA